jgi:hypothetical protein
MHSVPNHSEMTHYVDDHNCAALIRASPGPLPSRALRVTMRNVVKVVDKAASAVCC